LRRSIVVGTAGHIDHGKSALVRALTGTDPDRLKEEKARGITIDLGFAHAEIGGVNFAFVDVPGHERFVKNMLAGVGGIDLVVLVVGADESVMPQTREHFDICRLLRVPTGLVALTKSDLADGDTLELARMETRELVAGSFLDGAPMIPLSAKTGDGLNAFRDALLAVSSKARARSSTRVVRLPIDRVFSMKGFGTVVTGTLVSGRIDVDSDLTIMPGGRSVKVRGVQVHGARTDAVDAGQRTAVNLAGVDVSEITRGQNLTMPNAFVETRVAAASLDVLPGAKPVKHGTRIRFHQGTAETLGRIAIVGPDGAPAVSGERSYVRLRLEAPAVLSRGDRYIVRTYSPSVTIAGGVILDPAPPRGRLRSDAALDLLRTLDVDAAESSDNRAIAALVAAAGPVAFPVQALVSRAGLDRDAADAAVATLTVDGGVVRAGDVLVASPVVSALREAVLAALGDHHRGLPLSEGIPREELRAQLFRRGHAAVFERALADLVSAGKIVVKDRVALASYRLELTPDEARASAALERAYREGGLKPPEAATVAGALGLKPDVADRMLKLLQRQKVLVRLDDLVFHDAALKQLKAEMQTMKGGGAAAVRIDVATFKDRFGVSRKFAIPLLEYLDRERVTRRVGDARVLL
jgi:selenocysteine-specific elongation factor